MSNKKGDIWRFSLIELMCACVIAGIILGLNTVPRHLERTTDIAGWQGEEPPRLRDMKIFHEASGVVYVGTEVVSFSGWPLPFFWNDVNGRRFAIPFLLVDLVVFALVVVAGIKAVRVWGRKKVGGASVVADQRPAPPSDSK